MEILESRHLGNYNVTQLFEFDADKAWKEFETGTIVNLDTMLYGSKEVLVVKSTDNQKVIGILALDGKLEVVRDLINYGHKVFECTICRKSEFLNNEELLSVNIKITDNRGK